ncbi:MAG: hypothetical protein AAF402_12495 [Pseudomonadota bacterium]
MISRGHYSVILLGLAVAGCAGFPYQDRPIAQPPQSVEEVIESTADTSELAAGVPQACGSLNQFLFDIHKLDRQSQKRLLDDLGDNHANGFSCDRLKTGLLLSQIGKTISEDNLALEILAQYRKADRLTYSDQRLISVLIHHTEDRKRLHVLLQELGNQLVSEKAIARSTATKYESLLQQMQQLQKLESEINETEQSISAPATTGLTETSPENSGS